MKYHSLHEDSPEELPLFMKKTDPSQVVLINDILKTEGRAANKSQQAIALAAFHVIFRTFIALI